MPIDTGLVKREAFALVIISLLLLVLFSGAFGGAWTFLSITQAIPFIIVSGIVGVGVWGFKSRIEGNKERLRVERSDYRWPRLSIRIWFAPIGAGIDGLFLIYGAVASWQTAVAYQCYDPEHCVWGPVLNYGNVYSITLFATGLILLGIGYRMARSIQREIRYFLHGGV